MTVVIVAGQVLRSTSRAVARYFEIACLFARGPVHIRRAGKGAVDTHPLGSLYEAFPAARTRELANRLEIHYTP